MKEKFTLEAFRPVLAQCLTNADWKVRQAGFVVTGIIAESCQEDFKANMD